jgi:ribonuclease Z
MATTDSPQTVSFKLVFSGDCRPCDALIVAGQGATVLIHEATFEDSMMAEALAKRHTTVGEAVQVGMKINAERILLTHFSQRYPKVPTLAPDAHAESSSVIAQENANIQASDSIKSDSVTDERLQRVCIAFDCMCVSFRHLRTAPFLLAPFQALFPDEQGGSESQLT